MKIDIAVIIPAFNRGRLISETIDSVLGQTYSPREIIVVDDGSTDDTEEVVLSYGSAVQYVRIENSGVCKARNLGVNIAKSDWIAFCDHDDLWEREKLFYQVELIRSHPEVQYCFTNFRLVENGLWSKQVKFDEAPPGYWDIPKIDDTPKAFVVTVPFYPNIVKFQPVFPSTVIMRKEFFCRVGGFDESFGRMCSEDFEFTLRCTQESPIGVVTEPVVGIRKHDLNFSHGRLPGISFILSDIEILEYSLRNHRLGPRYINLIRESIVDRYISVAYEAFVLGEFELFKNAIKKIPLEKRSWKLKLKAAIVGLPQLFSRILKNIICMR